MVRVVLLFIHVTGALGVFSALAIEGAALRQIRKAADSTTLGAALDAFGLVARVAAPSLVATLGSGIYLASAVWGWRAAWIDVAFPALIATAVIGTVFTRPAITRLEKTLRRDDTVDSVLRGSFIVRTFVLMGIVFLMTTKPPLGPSLIAMAAAAGAGLLAARPRRRRAQSWRSAVIALTRLARAAGR
jgi:hypothetical protein